MSLIWLLFHMVMEFLKLEERKYRWNTCIILPKCQNLWLPWPLLFSQRCVKLLFLWWIYQKFWSGVEEVMWNLAVIYVKKFLFQTYILILLGKKKKGSIIQFLNKLRYFLEKIILCILKSNNKSRFIQITWFYQH